MGQRLIITEEERSRISGMYGLVNEQKVSAKQVAGPFPDKLKKDVNFYIFQDGSKFYIYVTNPLQKEPTLSWDNDGKGYPNEMEAKKTIDAIIKNRSNPSLNRSNPSYNKRTNPINDTGALGIEEQQQQQPPQRSPEPPTAPAPKPPKPSVKLQVFDNDNKLVMLIEIDRTSVKHNNLKSEFNYRVRGGSEEYTGYFNTRKPNKVELDRCELFNDRVIKRDYNEFAVAECPEDAWHEFNLSPEGSKVMDTLFGKESGRYVSNDSGEDMSNMA